MSTNIPENLKYTSDHEWVKVEGDTVTIGVSDFAQSNLGDIVFLELPEVETKVEKENAFGVVESIKSVSDLISPVTGEVIEFNQDLCDSPEQINNEPYDSWMIKIKLENPKELDELMDAEAYQNHCQENS